MVCRDDAQESALPLSCTGRLEPSVMLGACTREEGIHFSRRNNVLYAAPIPDPAICVSAAGIHSGLGDRAEARAPGSCPGCPPPRSMPFWRKCAPPSGAPRSVGLAQHRCAISSSVIRQHASADEGAMHPDVATPDPSRRPRHGAPELRAHASAAVAAPQNASNRAAARALAPGRSTQSTSLLG